MPREKKYTRTIAVRMTEEEWAAFAYGLSVAGKSDPTIKRPSDLLRKMMNNYGFRVWVVAVQEQAAKADRAAKRAAKKAANGDTQPA